MHTVEFQRTFDDLFAFNMHVYERSGLGRKRMIWGLATVGILFPPLAIWQYYLVGEPVVLAVWAASGIAFCLLWPRLNRLRLRACMRRNLRTMYKGATTSNHRLTLTDDGVQETTPEGQMFSSWNGVREIARTDRHLFVFTGPANAHVIPLSAFSTPADADAFASEMQRRHVHRREGQGLS